MFRRNPRSDQQTGFNCFDVAVGCIRKNLVDYALSHSSEQRFRDFLAPEIRHAAALTVVYMNLNADAGHQDAEKNVRLIELFEIASAFHNDDSNVQQAIALQIDHILRDMQRRQQQAHFPPGSLPECMRTPELVELITEYQSAHEDPVLRQTVIECRTALANPQLNSLGDLDRFFAQVQNCHDHRDIYTRFKHARDQLFTPSEQALNAYCASEVVYCTYLREYYAREGWVAFQRSFVGEHNQSIVDLAAEMLKSQIIIYQRCESSYQEIYRTAAYDAAVKRIELQHNNHFVELLADAPQLDQGATGDHDDHASLGMTPQSAHYFDRCMLQYQMGFSHSRTQELALKFFANFLRQHGYDPKREATDQYELAFIVVAHPTDSLLPFLWALSKMGGIAGLVLKGKHGSLRSLNHPSRIVTEIKQLFKQIILSFDRDTFNSQSLHNKLRIGKFICDLMRQFPHHRFIILDHGGYFAVKMPNLLQRFQERFLGIVEHTLNGEQRYQQQLIQLGNLPTPVYSIARSSLKKLEDIEVGKSMLEAIAHVYREGIREPSYQVGVVLVIGYGNMGRGFAIAWAEANLRNTQALYIADEQLLSLQQARADFERASLSDQHFMLDYRSKLAEADLIVVATSRAIVDDEFIGLMKDQACLALVTSSDDLFIGEPLRAQQYYAVYTPARDGAQRYVKRLSRVQSSASDIRTIYLAAGGRTLNFLVGSTAHPILYPIFASICSAAHHLIGLDDSSRTQLRNQVQSSDAAVEDKILEQYQQVFGQGAVPTLVSAVFAYDGGPTQGELEEERRFYQDFVSSTVPRHTPVVQAAATRPTQQLLVGRTNVFASAQHFIGRQIELAQLNDCLKQQIHPINNTAQARIVGPSGIGKTTLLAHYAELNRVRYNKIVWLDGLTFRRDYVKVVLSVLGEEVLEEDIETKIEAVNAILFEHDFLFVVDNYRDELEPYLPNQASQLGHILLSHKLPHLCRTNSDMISLGIFAIQDAVHFFDGLRACVCQHCRIGDFQTCDDMIALVRDITFGYPILLNEAALYLKNHAGVKLAAFNQMVRLSREQDNYYEEESPNEEASEDEDFSYSRAFYSIIKLNIQSVLKSMLNHVKGQPKVERKVKVFILSIALLRFLAVIDERELSRNLLKFITNQFIEQQPLFAEFAEVINTDQLIHKMLLYGLLQSGQLDESQYVMHSAIKDIILRILFKDSTLENLLDLLTGCNKSILEAEASALLFLNKKSFSTVTLKMIHQCLIDWARGDLARDEMALTALSQNLMTIMALAKNRGHYTLLELDEYYYFFMLLARFANSRGFHKINLNCIECAIHLDKEQLPGWRRVKVRLMHAKALIRYGEFDRAQQELMAILQLQYGSQQQQQEQRKALLATVNCELAKIKIYTNEFLEAEVLLKDALGSITPTDGADLPIESYNIRLQLAKVYSKLDRNEEAIEQLELAERILCDTYTSQCPQVSSDVAVSLEDLPQRAFLLHQWAYLFIRARRYEEARQKLEQGLQLVKKHESSKDMKSNQAAYLHLKGLLFFIQDDFMQALDQFESARELLAGMHKATITEYDVNVYEIKNLHYLGKCYDALALREPPSEQKQNFLRSAKYCFDQALLLEIELAQPSFRVIDLYNRVGEYYFQQGNKQQALVCYDNAYSVMRILGYSDDHPLVRDHFRRLVDLSVDVTEQALTTSTYVDAYHGISTTRLDRIVDRLVSESGDKFYITIIDMARQAAREHNQVLAKLLLEKVKVIVLELADKRLLQAKFCAALVLYHLLLNVNNDPLFAEPMLQQQEVDSIQYNIIRVKYFYLYIHLRRHPQDGLPLYPSAYSDRSMTLDSQHDIVYDWREAFERDLTENQHANLLLTLRDIGVVANCNQMFMQAFPDAFSKEVNAQYKSQLSFAPLQYWRQRIADMRQAFYLLRPNIAEWMRDYSQLIESYINAMIESNIALIGPPPQAANKFSVLLLGSLAKSFMLSKSDIEFAILLPNNNQAIQGYFRVLMRLLKFDIINLGETSMHLAPKYYQGIRLDSPGNFPFGIRNAKLIGTVDELLQQVAVMTDQYNTLCVENVFVMTMLMTPRLLGGDLPLFREYQDKLLCKLIRPLASYRGAHRITVDASQVYGEYVLNEDDSTIQFLPSGAGHIRPLKGITGIMNLGQALAMHLIKNHLIDFPPIKLPEDVMTVVIDIKKTLLRPVTLFIKCLLLFQGFNGFTMNPSVVSGEVTLQRLTDLGLIETNSAIYILHCLHNILELRNMLQHYGVSECPDLLSISALLGQLGHNNCARISDRLIALTVFYRKLYLAMRLFIIDRSGIEQNISLCLYEIPMPEHWPQMEHYDWIETVAMQQVQPSMHRPTREVVGLLQCVPLGLPQMCIIIGNSDSDPQTLGHRTFQGYSFSAESTETEGMQCHFQMVGSLSETISIRVQVVADWCIFIAFAKAAADPFIRYENDLITRNDVSALIQFIAARHQKFNSDAQALLPLFPPVQVPSPPQLPSIVTAVDQRLLAASTTSASLPVTPTSQLQAPTDVLTPGLRLFEPHSPDSASSSDSPPRERDQQAILAVMRALDVAYPDTDGDASYRQGVLEWLNGFRGRGLSRTERRQLIDKERQLRDQLDSDEEELLASNTC